MNDEYSAEVLVHSIQGPEPCCRKHADKLAALMHFMGTDTNKTPAPDGAQCNNCRNEKEAGR